MSADRLVAAEALLEAVQAEPARVEHQAAELVAALEAAVPPEPEALVVARFALGRAQHETGAIGAACATLAEAAELAERLGLSEREGHILGSLALSQTAHAEPEEAGRTLLRAEALLDGAARARLTMQRAIMAVHQGDLEGGLRAFDDAHGPLVEAGDDLAVARLHLSRGVAHSLLGDHAAADADYQAGGDLAARLGQAALAASARANLAYSRGQAGDLAAALESFDQARAAYRDAGDPRRYVAALEADRCTVLLIAGLHREAIEAAERALDLSRDGENRVQEAEALLMLSRARFAAGRTSGAIQAASAAAELFRSAGRDSWAAQAEFLAVIAEPGRSAESESRLRALTEQLEATGWAIEALQIRTLLGMSLVDVGRLDDGRRELDAAAAGRHTGTAEQRSRAWYAFALERRASGDLDGAARAVGEGLDLVDRHRLLLGATELRMHATHHRRALADLGIELALDDGRGRPESVLAAADREREGAASLPAARPEDDPEVARLISEHRRLSAEARQRSGDGDGDGDGETDTGAVAAVAENEAKLRDVLRRSRAGRPSRDGRAAGDSAADHSAASDSAAGDSAALQVGVDAVVARLGPRVLAHYHQIGGCLGVVVVAGGISVRIDLGDVDDVRRRVDGLFFGLRRITSHFGSEAGLRSAADGLDADAGWLHDTLLAPVLEAADSLGRPSLGTATGNGPELVIVPADVIAELPWHAVARRPLAVTVVPSLRLWLRPARRAERARTMTAIAGPDLPAARAEVAALAERGRGSSERVRVVEGAAATVDVALEALVEDDIVHIAAHGEFRSDNPLFSSLAMHDGPLAVFDIERLERVPSLVVLSACHAGRGAVGLPGELLGTSHALLHMGARTVVSPVLAVPDEAMAQVMVEVHDGLFDGLRAPEALRRVVAAHQDRDGLVGWTARLLTVQGCDDAVL